jgi:TonB family protein
MRSAKFLIAAAAASILCAAAEPVRLQPSSKWVLDYDDDSCRLIRTFGEGRHKTSLVFESGAPGEISMVAVGQDLKGRRSLALNGSATPEQGTATFVPVGSYKFQGRLAETSSGHQPAIFWDRINFGKTSDASDAPDDLKKAMAEAYAKRNERPSPRDLAKRAASKAESEAFAAGVRAIEIEPRPGRAVLLETGSLAEPVKMFDQCIRDEMRGWGIDPDLEDKIARPVWALNPGEWLSSADYPMDMIRKSQESAVRVRLLIDAAGKVTNCTTVTQVDAPDFERAVCSAILAHARFAPAELADGMKVPSYYMQQIIFRLGPESSYGTRLITH